MCRLMFIPASKDINAESLESQFRFLERSCGGDGNGFALISPKEGRAIVVRKGVKLDAGVCAAEIARASKKGYHAIWHTRKVSVGWLDDAQCHPHEYSGRGRTGVIAHNGTWYSGEALANWLGCGSDTAALARCIGRFGIGGAMERDLFPSSGVFLVANQDAAGTELRAILKSGDLQYDPVTGCWASQFSRLWGSLDMVYDVKHGSHNLLTAPPEDVKIGLGGNWQETGSGTYRYLPAKYRADAWGRD